jgi:hypothetical protein
MYNYICFRFQFHYCIFYISMILIELDWQLLPTFIESNFEISKWVYG